MLFISRVEDSKRHFRRYRDGVAIARNCVTEGARSREDDDGNNEISAFCSYLSVRVTSNRLLLAHKEVGGLDL